MNYSLTSPTVPSVILTLGLLYRISQVNKFLPSHFRTNTTYKFFPNINTGELTE